VNGQVMKPTILFSIVIKIAALVFMDETATAS
jgi:hypothetical protein